MVIDRKLIQETGLTIGAIGVIVTALWTAGNATGYRPALIKELHVAQNDVQQLARSVQWIELDNLENKYAKGVLSDQEKAKRCQLAYMLQAFYVKDCVWPAPPPTVVQQ